MKILGQPFGIHEKALGLRNRRMEMLARNIANADTPHFKAQDIDFKTVLKQFWHPTFVLDTKLQIRP